MSVKEKGMYTVLELVLEMYERGFKFLPIDLYKSHATKFLMEEDGIRPPLNSIPGLGSVAAEGIAKAVEIAVEEIKAAIEKRDEIDKNKKVGALKIAEDATYIDTSLLTIDEVCEIIIGKIHL